MRGGQQLDIDNDYVELRDTMVELGKKNVGKTKVRADSKPWWSKSIAEKYKIYKDAQREMKKRCDQGRKDKFIVARENFLSSCHKAKNKTCGRDNSVTEW